MICKTWKTITNNTPESQSNYYKLKQYITKAHWTSFCLKHEITKYVRNLLIYEVSNYLGYQDLNLKILTK
jgi:hypothetical protein